MIYGKCFNWGLIKKCYAILLYWINKSPPSLFVFVRGYSSSSENPLKFDIWEMQFLYKQDIFCSKVISWKLKLTKLMNDYRNCIKHIAFFIVCLTDILIRYANHCQCHSDKKCKTSTIFGCVYSRYVQTCFYNTQTRFIQFVCIHRRNYETTSFERKSNP